MKHLFTTLIIGLLATQVLAQTISIQGVLRDPNGRSVDDGAYSVVFKIYDVATDGTALWSDTYSSLQTKHGVFQANLGEQTTLDGLAFDKTYYVGVTVENFAEMTPRIALTVYPYAKAILGQDNKFPSTGNIVLAKDSIIVEQGALKFEGPDGRIVFNDGTSLNSANFSGPAGSLLNSSSVNINADNDSDGTGAINFQTKGVSRVSIANDGNATFNGSINAASGISSGTYNAGLGVLNLYGPDAASASGGQLNLFTSDTRATEKWFFQPNENNLFLGHETGGNFPIVATFSSTKVDFENDIVAKGNISSKLDIYAGEDDAVAGFLNLYGSAAGASQGGRVNFYKAADHDNNDGQQEYWFMEANNDDFRIGNIFVNNDVMTFRGDGNVGFGGANDPQIDLAIGDHDTGLNWVSDGAFNLMQNGNQALSVGNNGKIGIGDNTPTEAQLVVRGSAFVDHFTVQNLDSNPVFNQELGALDWGIYSEKRIMAAGGISTASDARIKKIVARSNSSADLEVINNLKITDYTHIDVVNNGKQLEKKLIAQEVDKAFPIAVNKSTGFVPTIYKQASNSTFVNGELTIIMDDIHSLKAGEKVKIYSEHGEIVEEVLTVTKNGFTIKTDSPVEKAFVYGIEVDDFHTVDYDAISMLNVSATQELAKRTENQEARIAALEAENTALKKKLETLNALEAKVNALLGIGSEDSTLIGQK